MKVNRSYQTLNQYSSKTFCVTTSKGLVRLGLEKLNPNFTIFDLSLTVEVSRKEGAKQLRKMRKEKV